MSKAKEDIMVDFEEILRKAVASVEIDISKSADERMKLISDTFDLALIEYIRELPKQIPEKDRMRKAAAMIAAYGTYERGIFSLDLLAESLAKILRKE